MNNFGILFTVITFAVVCITNSASNSIDRNYHLLDGQKEKYYRDVIYKLAHSLARLNGNQEDYVEIYDPDNIEEVFNTLGRSYIRYNKYQDVLNKLNKHIGLGLNPGFSAAQAAKMRMGILAAQNPRGPGRRRRSVDRENLFNSASSKAYDSPAEDSINMKGRSYSTSQLARLLMALAAANNPHGPGRRRRSVDRLNHFNTASTKAYDSPAEDRLLEKIWP